MNSQTRNKSILAAFIIGFTSQAGAQISVARYLEFGATTTDNSTLVEHGGETEFIASVKPSVELKFSGNRFGSIVIGEVEHFRYNDADKDITDPRILARTRGTLIDNLLYLDSTLTYSKLAPDSNFLRPSDDSDPALNFKSSLFVFREFGELADLYVGYSHRSFFADPGESASTRENGIDFNFGKNPRFGGFLWEVGGFYTDDESDDSTFENSSVFASIGSVFSDTMYAEVLFGQESRLFVTDEDTLQPTTLEDESDPIWDVSFTWTPTENTELTLGYGERFFGSGPNMSLIHRSASSLVELSYSRDVSRFGPSLGGISTLSGTGEDTILDTSTVSLDDAVLSSVLAEPFVDNSLAFSYKLAGRRSDIIFDAIYSEQDQLGGDEEITSWLGRFIFDRKLSELSLLRFQYDYQQSDAPLRASRNYTENRFAVKFILNFDRVDSTRDEDFAE